MYFDAGTWSLGATAMTFFVEGARAVGPLVLAVAGVWLAARRPVARVL